MKRRALWTIVVVFVLALILVAPAAAYYTNVTGELRDIVTDSTWVHGATVTVHHCDSGTIVAGPVVVGASGTFDISLTGVYAPRLCIVVDFNAAPNGEPSSTAKAFDNLAPGVSGSLDAGIFYANTGPNAVTFRDIRATAGSISPALFALGSALLGAVSLVAIRRKHD